MEAGAPNNKDGFPLMVPVKDRHPALVAITLLDHAVLLALTLVTLQKAELLRVDGPAPAKRVHRGS